MYDGLCIGVLDAAQFHDYDYLDKLTLGRVPALKMIALLERLSYKMRTAEGLHSPSLLSSMDFDYAILAYELRDMRGSLYFKRKSEKRFIKFGPYSPYTIEIEREITENAGGSYRFLEGEKRTLDNRIITRYFRSFYQNPTGERRKRKNRPTVKSLLAGAR